MAADVRDVDPRVLRVPPRVRSARIRPSYTGKSPSSATRMPPLWVFEAADGVLVVYNGVTRATRIAKLAPGTTVPVEVLGKLPHDFAGSPSIGDLLP